ncbi:MAG TPA: DDE-type integrase/transposase/recombinase [Candidatus Limnocylindrales bacterium]|nr:DDE-type integrase/transposase/recombinase [Candidatus Limnocylindrales bacterium]
MLDATACRLAPEVATVLGQDDLLAWFQRLSIPEPTCSMIDHIRSSNPSRRVGGGRSNVSGRYPSRKMGVTIQFESHRVELAGIYEMEHDATVLEYFDQPPAIKLDYESVAGKRMGVLHTPDFFVIRRGEAGWEEWKTEEELRRLNMRNPNRYAAGSDEPWRCPPGQAYAERLGLYYRVRSSAEINWVFQRNIQFMEDYLRADLTAIAAGSRDIVIACVSANPGLALEDLLRSTAGRVPPDDIFSMIAANVVYVDLHAAPLAEPSRVAVLVAPGATPKARDNGTRKLSSCSFFDLHCGSTVTWDDRFWNVVNIGETSVGLLSDDQRLTELPKTAVEALICQNRMQLISPGSDHESDSAICKLLSGAREHDLYVANQRARLIRDYLANGRLPAELKVTGRTFLRWLARYRAAEGNLGVGYLGLLPKSGDRGNCTPRLSEASLRLMKEFLEQDYETLKQKTRYASWVGLKLACEHQGVAAPSYKTFCVAVKNRPALNQTLKRQGRRASYKLETFYWELDQKTPRHGDRPFEIVHVDHTELDVESVASTGQVLGRPWMTIATDAFSRRILAFYLTFDAPSYRSCMMALRECVRRLSRLPQILVVDGGREFESTYFETLLARYECTKKTRPPAQARFGAVCERLFGTTNTQFIHNLRGNTQITRNVRQVTKSVDPKSLATWPLAELHQRLSQYLYEVCDTFTHPALGQSPREAFETGLALTGSRLHRLVPYNEEFLMLTLPTTAKGTAKVMPSRGVKINHICYWCEAFRDPEVQCASVPVRYDPFDAGMAYAFVRKQWLQCHSEYYAVLKGRSEREIMLATNELHQRRRNHSAAFTVTARQLAEFLQSVEAEEKLLTQRLSDLESRDIRLTLAKRPFNEGCAPCREADVPAAQSSGQPVDETTGSEVYGAF